MIKLARPVILKIAPDKSSYRNVAFGVALPECGLWGGVKRFSLET
jgi:hypothetical protein